MSTSGVGEDGHYGVSEQEFELARSAKEAFDNHRYVKELVVYGNILDTIFSFRYENCLSTLKKLVELRQEDARVTHNKAVAQYLLSNLTKTDEFRRTLQAVESQFERDAENSGGEMSVTEKSVLLFNKALIHQRVRPCYG